MKSRVKVKLNLVRLLYILDRNNDILNPESAEIVFI